MKSFNHLITTLLLACLYACSTRDHVTSDGYRYVTYENIPRGEMGKVIGKPTWIDPAHIIKSKKADSFYVYGKFDSIRMVTPGESYGSMFRKKDIRAISWKATPNYGELNFVGNFIVDHLPGMYISFYFTKDRSTLMQALYTNPGNNAGVILFHKDSVNILKKAGIVVDPRDNQK